MDEQRASDQLADNAIEKIDAGAQLVYALYHMPADTIRQILDIAPPHFGRTLARAHAAYGVGHHRADPVKAVD